MPRKGGNLSRTFTVKFTCSHCHTPVYKVTKNVNVDKQWCSPCSQGKPVKQTTEVSQNQTERGAELIQTEFDPVIATEKDILYYLRLLHRVEELLLENYKTPETCHFTQLWDKAKEDLN